MALGRKSSFSLYGQSSLVVDGTSLASLRDYHAGRESSYDRTGGNADWIVIPPKTEGKLGEIQGPGMITHIWIPFGATGDRVRREVLRIYWDGEREPSVEAPVQDFFGLALGEYANHQSALLSAAPWNGLNAYFPMPFAQTALITMSNDNKENLHIYCHIDYVKLAGSLEGAGYFHAQYRQHVEVGETNGTDSGHVIFEAEGRGHVVGFSRGVVTGLHSEIRHAREYLYLDGSDPLVDVSFRCDLGLSQRPSDSMSSYSFEFEGKPEVVVGVFPTGRYRSYRWFVEGSPAFRERAKAAIAVAKGNSIGSDLYTVAYWYQTEPHRSFPKLPAMEDRIPRSLADSRSPAPTKDSTAVTV